MISQVGEVAILRIVLKKHLFKNAIAIYSGLILDVAQWTPEVSLGNFRKNQP